MRRQGFTLVELLVVITIIGILMGLLLPAVQNARESGRRIQCANNLHQIGIALQAYHKDHDILPMGYWMRWAPQGQDPPKLEDKGAMLYLILPYLDQEALYRQFDFDKWDNNAYLTRIVPNTSTALWSFVLPVFVCPSDEYRGVWRDVTPIRALSNYAGSSGSRKLGVVNSRSSKPCPCDEIEGWNTFAKGGTQGPFYGHNSLTTRPACRFAQIRDGLSNTIMVGEMRPRCQSVARVGWGHSNHGSGICTTTIPINFDSCEEDNLCQPDGCSSYRNENTALSFKSMHPGGAQFLMCDGSVRFLPESIDHEMYQRLGAIDDGLPIREASETRGTGQ